MPASFQLLQKSVQAFLNLAAVGQSDIGLRLMALQFYAFFRWLWPYQFFCLFIQLFFLIRLIEFKIVADIPLKISLVVCLFHQVLLFFLRFIHLRSKHVFQHIFINLSTAFNLNTLTLRIFNAVIKVLVQFLIWLQFCLGNKIFIYFLQTVLLFFLILALLLQFSFLFVFIFGIIFILFILTHQRLDIFTPTHLAVFIELFEHLLNTLLSLLKLFDFVVYYHPIVFCLLHFLMDALVIEGLQLIYLLYQ